MLHLNETENGSICLIKKNPASFLEIRYGAGPSNRLSQLLLFTRARMDLAVISPARPSSIYIMFVCASFTQDIESKITIPSSISRTQNWGSSNSESTHVQSLFKIKKTVFTVHIENSLKRILQVLT